MKNNKTCLLLGLCLLSIGNIASAATTTGMLQSFLVTLTGKGQGASELFPDICLTVSNNSSKPCGSASGSTSSIDLSISNGPQSWQLSLQPNAPQVTYDSNCSSYFNSPQITSEEGSFFIKAEVAATGSGDTGYSYTIQNCSVSAVPN